MTWTSPSIIFLVPGGDPLWLKVVPIIISICALTVALSSATFTAYFQYFKKPHLSIVVSTEMHAWRTPEMQLVFVVPIVIANEGARYGVVHRIGGTITMADGYESDFRWHMFSEPKALGDESRESKVWGGFAGWAETLVVPNRSAITKRVQFVSARAVIVVPGRYRIAFNLYSTDSNEVVAQTRVSYDITKGLEAELIAGVVNPQTRTVDRSVRISLVQA